MGDLREKAVNIFKRHGGILRMSEAIEAGISRRTLYQLRAEGVLEVLSRGLYRLADMPGLEAPDLVTVASRVPSGVLCLISALSYHELTTQVPHMVDIALIRGSEKPAIDYPPIKIYWFSGKAYSEGIETHTIDGQKVRIYNPEKSLADAFKYRNKLGIDVAVEALRNWRNRRGANMNKLTKYARICRVESVMKPYIEALS